LNPPPGFLDEWFDVRRDLRHPRDTMTIDCAEVGGKVVLHVVGRMDAENSVQFERQCDSCISEGKTSLIVDLGDLSYVSSMGLRSFVGVAQKLKNKGGELRICRMTGLVRQVFEITRLNQVFPMYESVESALLGG
jgi:anti-sigma B factor antagonist